MSRNTLHTPYNKFYSVLPMQAPIGTKPVCYILLPSGKYVCANSLFKQECLCHSPVQLYNYPADPDLKSMDVRESTIVSVQVKRISPKGEIQVQRVKQIGRRKYNPPMNSDSNKGSRFVKKILPRITNRSVMSRPDQRSTSVPIPETVPIVVLPPFFSESMDSRKIEFPLLTHEVPNKLPDIQDQMVSTRLNPRAKEFVPMHLNKSI